MSSQSVNFLPACREFTSCHSKLTLAGGYVHGGKLRLKRINARNEEVFAALGNDPLRWQVERIGLIVRVRSNERAHGVVVTRGLANDRVKAWVWDWVYRKLLLGREASVVGPAWKASAVLS